MSPKRRNAQPLEVDAIEGQIESPMKGIREWAANRALIAEGMAHKAQTQGFGSGTYTIATAPVGAISYSGPSLMTLTTSGTNQ